MKIAPFKPLMREDVVDVLNISLSTLDTMVCEGSIPLPRRIGSCRRLYWHPDVFFEWLDSYLRSDENAVRASSETESDADGERTSRRPPKQDRSSARVAERSRATSSHEARQAEKMARMNIDDEDEA
jgi:predicted DNA-binding transcriptional regulator AlpA